MLINSNHDFDEESEVQPVELYYSKGSPSAQPSESDLTMIDMNTEGQESDSKRIVELLNERG